MSSMLGHHLDGHLRSSHDPSPKKIESCSREKKSLVISSTLSFLLATYDAVKLYIRLHDEEAGPPLSLMDLSSLISLPM